MSADSRSPLPRASLLPCLALLAASLFAASPAIASAKEGDPVPSAWDQAAIGLLKEAHASFARQPAGDREARFGEAVTLINLQPKTDSNLDRAAALLTSVFTADPADDLGINARYFLARIAQVHRANPDASAALALHRELDALNSPYPLAQRAVVQIALLELFEPRVPAAEVRARFDRLAARGATLTDPSALRDFHLIMGDAALRFGLGDPLALDHLLAADRAGIARPVTQRDCWLRIAELARRSGRADIAATYYERFLQHFLRDSRRLMIKERLAALPAAQPKEPAR